MQLGIQGTKQRLHSMSFRARRRGKRRTMRSKRRSSRMRTRRRKEAVKERRKRRRKEAVKERRKRRRRIIHQRACFRAGHGKG
jgi:hypothetical protein